MAECEIISGDRENAACKMRIMRGLKGSKWILPKVHITVSRRWCEGNIVSFCLLIGGECIRDAKVLGQHSGIG